MSGTQEGILLIADITGYTMYLSKSELDHAREILTTLLTLLVDHTRPPLVISRLAGDAVISYALGDHFVQEQTFVEMIEDTFLAFRKAIEQMVLNNACRCNACANVTSLDLKFFVHYGTFARQRIDDHDELVGNDVNLIHRLLKNHVSEKLGFRAYTLYTQAAIRRLGIEAMGENMLPHIEAYEHLGEVQVWVQNMQPIWEQKSDAKRITIPPDQIVMQVETEIAMPVELVWDYLSQPEFRRTLWQSDRQQIINPNRGRIAPGSVYQCFHGDKMLTHTILEWQPFEYIITQDLIPVPIPNTFALLEYRLVPTENGARFIQTFSKATGPFLGRILSDRTVRRMAKRWQMNIESFKQQIEKDLAMRREDTGVTSASS
jgi:uncharacterized protein YndB with AHSA1/START domain